MVEKQEMTIMTVVYFKGCEEKIFTNGLASSLLDSSSTSMQHRICRGPTFVALSAHEKRGKGL